MRVRQWTALALSAMMLGGTVMTLPARAESTSSAAEEAWNPDDNRYDYDELTVGTTTPFDGNFFSGMWGNAVSDLDVRTLVHGYNLIEWKSAEGTFGLDPSVVSGITVTQNAEGDKTYVLSVYEDLFYSDGTAITAKDYAFSLLLSIAPEVKEIGGSVRSAEYLAGYEAYMSGEADALAGVRLLGDYILSVTISHEYLPFFYELGLLDCTPYPIHVLAPGCTVVDEGSGVKIANLPAEDGSVPAQKRFTAELLRQTILDEESGYLSHPSVASGPYLLEGFDGTTAHFSINPYYKGNSEGLKPTIPRLTYTVADNADMIDELAHGGYGLLNKCVKADVLQEGMRLVAGSELMGMSNYPRNGLSMISFCTEQPLVGSAAMRQAIAYCLDKDALVRDYIGYYGLRVDGYYGIGQWMYQVIEGNMTIPLDPPEDETDAEAQAAYERDLEAWRDLSLDGVQAYDQDLKEAVRLFEEEGFTLDADGQAYDAEAGGLRYRKEDDGSLTPLSFSLLLPEGNSIIDALEESFAAPLSAAGAELAMTAVPMDELLHYYYSQEDRFCDMIYLATNFDIVFDPSLTFLPGGDGARTADTKNTTGINDEELYELAVALRRTEPGDTLSYCQKWVAFQERFAEVLPVIPVYSNVYFDFYPRVLHGYAVSEAVTWGQAIVGAYLGDYEDEEEPETVPETEEFDDGEIEIFD